MTRLIFVVSLLGYCLRPGLAAPGGCVKGSTECRGDHTSDSSNLLQNVLLHHEESADEEEDGATELAPDVEQVSSKMDAMLSEMEDKVDTSEVTRDKKAQNNYDHHELLRSLSQYMGFDVVKYVPEVANMNDPNDVQKAMEKFFKETEEKGNVAGDPSPIYDNATMALQRASDSSSCRRDDAAIKEACELTGTQHEWCGGHHCRCVRGKISNCWGCSHEAYWCAHWMKWHIFWSHHGPGGSLRGRTPVCDDVVVKYVYDTCARDAVHKLLEEESHVTRTTVTEEHAALDEALSGKRTC